MTILSGDIKLLASKVMDDVPNGGGGPTGTVIADGASNAVFGDVTERQRAGGGVSIRQLFLAVQTPDTDAYRDPSIIVSQVPNDPNVSITLAKTSMFAKRTDIANTLENYLIKGPEWGGFLFENHVAGQRSIQLFQRPGTPTPPIGRTLALISAEGLPGEVTQYVRVTRAEVEQRIFTYSTGNGFVDFQADVVTCDLSDALRTGFAGSPPDRSFARSAIKTVVRDTTVADAATFYGAAPLTSPALLGDSLLSVSTVYTQLVPSARTEIVALDQRPAAQRSLVLAESPRRVEVGAAPHTRRLKVGQENRSFSWVELLRPAPAPGTIVVSYMALGNWYTLIDDGAGAFTGAGVGTVNYATGSVAVTLPSLPDVGSSVIFAWGEKSAFVNRSGQAGFRAPEYAVKLDNAGIKPETLTIEWMSGGVLKTAYANALGTLLGDAAGEVSYASGDLFIRPAFMPDAGGEFNIDYEWAALTTKSVVATPDAGGFATVALDSVPAARSVTLEWITVRNVSNSSGATASGTSSAKKASTSVTSNFTTPVYYPGSEGAPSEPGAPAPTPGTPAPPPAPPVSLTRVAFGGDNGAVPYMAGGGVRTSTGKPVFIAVQALYTDNGGYYPVPDAAGVEWSEAEFNTTRAKNIGGTQYRRWGADSQARVAEGA